MMRKILIASANMSIQLPISEIPTYFHKLLEESIFAQEKEIWNVKYKVI